MLLSSVAVFASCAGAGHARPGPDDAARSSASGSVVEAAGAAATTLEPDGRSLTRFAIEQGGLFDCFTKLLRTTEKRGKVVLQFAILPDGKVQGVQVLESSLDDEAATSCIVARASKWTTPFRPAALRIFRYPVIIN
jgi:hypothetical protein